jgi:deazaflavin-dependent oxidoreductase (nitroreductase family)
MIITASIITLLAILLAPIPLIRFHKRWVAAFNLAVTNRITSQFAARLPGFGILTHVGRKSGRVYRTPVNVFRTPEGFLIALTYGRESQWVRNVLAAGACQLETRRMVYQLSAPTIVHDPTRRRFPLPVRMILRLIGANDFMHLSTSHVTSGHSDTSAVVRDEKNQITGRTSERFHTTRDGHGNLVSINSPDPGLLIGRKK